MRSLQYQVMEFREGGYWSQTARRQWRWKSMKATGILSLIPALHSSPQSLASVASMSLRG